ncbi:MAG TPA: ATP-binding protein [Longimicrobiaceae bacterium]|nr:ATP-binding protein [Longimicrobiaceae bacterium]
MSQPPSPELAALGLASAALMHDLQAMTMALREHAAYIADEVEAGRLPSSSTRALLARCDEIQGMISDVVQSVSGGRMTTPLNPVESVHREIGRITQRASPLKISCRVSLPSGVWVEGRRTLLERSVGNLLRNAVRHARTRVEVGISAEEIGGALWLVVAVEDDGAGVPQEVRERLFTPGGRAGTGGSGIGLASVAWAMGQLGGGVRLAEPAVLGGARFEVRAPLRGHTEAASTAAPERRVLVGRTIVVIDDDEMLRRSTVRLLAYEGARVVTVDVADLGSDEALDELAESAPDAVLLDLRLGAMSGVRLWHRLNARFPELASRVAFFSGAAGWIDDDQEIRETGRPVLAKGMEIHDLIAALSRLIEAGARDRV